MIDIHAQKEKMLAIAMRQVAIDLSAEAACFTEEKNVVAVYEQDPARRKFGKDSPHAFKMAGFGRGTVLSAPGSIQKKLQNLVEHQKGTALFDYENLYQIDQILREENLTYATTTLAYLPAVDEPVDAAPEGNIHFVWYEQADMPALYKHQGLHNAVGYDMQALRPDVLAVAAFEGKDLLGAAGASKDAALLWQIGIDVVPAARGKGIGTLLVDLLRAEVQNRGAVPYYCTSTANLFSRNIAVNCGFFPAWVEGYANEIKGD